MRLYDTMARAIVELVPEGETLTIYSCGPTVYREAHIGNLRTFLAADLVVRTARYLSVPVRQVQNITDVGHMTDEVFGEAGEDRIEQAAAVEGLSPAEIAEHYTAVFLADIDAMGIGRADAYPRASHHVPEMISLIERLLARGHAYEVSGTVYYDTRSFPAYGRLSGNVLDQLEADHRKTIGDTGKKHPSDFVLWMTAGPNRLTVFDSPWGPGYPGWHIECSAMSLAAFGERIDLHTGGEDNVFPHHEDEIAQSEGALGHRVVRHWLHGAHLLAEGRKMSKSARNDYTLRDLAAHGHADPRALRLLFLQSKYRSQMNFTFEALTAAERGLARWRRAAGEWAAAGGTPSLDRLAPYEARFREAIADDLDTPRALRLLGEVAGHASLAPADRLEAFRRWDEVFGLELAGSSVTIPDAVHALAAERQAARDAKDFGAADRLRDRIEAEGFAVLDRRDGYDLRRR